MRRKTLQLIIACAVAAGPAAGCGTSSSAPSHVTDASATQPVFTLSGQVIRLTAAGLVPVAHARVQAMNTFGFSDTDANGVYTIRGLPAAEARIDATKWGFETLTSRVSIAADTKRDLVMVRFPTFTISGVVSEMTAAGPVPLAGVDLYCDSCGEEGHTFEATDARGFYRFPEAYAGMNLVLLRKAGYADPPGLPASRVNGWQTRDVVVSGDTRVDVTLIRQ